MPQLQLTYSETSDVPISKIEREVVEAAMAMYKVRRRRPEVWDQVTHLRWRRDMKNHRRHLTKCCERLALARRKEQSYEILLGHRIR